MDDQPSFTPETKQTSNSNGNSGNTGKWKASDLYTEGIQNYIKKHSDSQFQKDDDMSFGSKQSIEKMNAQQLEAFSSQIHKEYYQAEGKFRAYLCVFFLICISLVSTLQRASVIYMFNFPPPHFPN